MNVNLTKSKSKSVAGRLVKAVSLSKLREVKPEPALHPHQCACTLVKEKKIAACPVHWMTSLLAEARH